MIAASGIPAADLPSWRARTNPAPTEQAAAEGEGAS